MIKVAAEPRDSSFLFHVLSWNFELGTLLPDHRLRPAWYACEHH